MLCLTFLPKKNVFCHTVSEQLPSQDLTMQHIKSLTTPTVLANKNGNIADSSTILPNMNKFSHTVSEEKCSQDLTMLTQCIK